MNQTTQEEVWKTNFGEEYNHRNNFDNKALDDVYISDIGISRTEMNEEFIGNLNRDIKILEVGCNIGMQLVNLNEMGFRNLYGIELQPHAVELAKQKTKGMNIIQGTAYDIPFKDEYFDLVFTSRVLIHMNPNEINKAIREIVRCSKEYIYGNEYYADELTEIKNYHGQNNIAWKRNFPQLYLDNFPDLKLLKEEKYKYTFNDDLDTTYLFKK
ncbi:MAG: methyltransferase domain-containing protein [Ignavibacteria bacterium]|nr:methyltransferase domain-containing protein [Ignavibacteriota bacterium]